MRIAYTRRVAPGEAAVIFTLEMDKGTLWFSVVGDAAGDAGVRVEFGEDRVTVRPVGDIDQFTATPLTAALNGACDSGRDIVVDLSQATFFGASGVNCIAAAWHKCRTKGRQLRVEAASTTVSRMLRVAGFGDVLRPRLPRQQSSEGPLAVG